MALEISLRRRLMDTLESRMAWATALKESLQHQVNGNATPETVRNVALDTLRAIEAPSDILLSQDPPLPFQSIRLSHRRPLPLNPAITKSKPSFLFVRSSNLDLPLNRKNDSDKTQEETTLYLLKCPACSKTSFTSLQGLLNHARLVHSLEWGTHEECITACAVPDNTLDVASGTEVGLGPTGILPGLRNIFQMAVCGHGSRPERDENAGDDTLSAKTSLILNQSLGLHDESPALAPFLGKDPIRRQIKATDEDLEVDIEDVNQHIPSSRRWRMSFAQRSSNFFALPVPEALNTKKNSSAEPSKVENLSSTVKHTTIAANSRFHLVSRIIITDRSLWIPPEERTSEHQKYTHRWMISVDSPSYAHHITSILNSIQVTPADPTVHIPVPPPKTGPPFVVLGLADKGFLAKITLFFTGHAGLPASEQTFIFEHWIDLYPLKESHIIKGQDQVVDIELDKDTIIRPPQRDYTPIDSKSLWNQVFQAALLPKADQLDHPMEEYEERLTEIAERFPMTIEDFKGKRNKLPKVPYMLATSVRHILTFVTGRRKAIEWARARAIHEAYIQSRADSFKLPTLTVGDIYSWLSEKGHFPRSSYGSTLVVSRPSVKAQNNANTSEDAEPIWCRFCGLDTRLHGNNSDFPKKEDMDIVPPPEDVDGKAKLQVTSVSECPFVSPGLCTDLPRIDVKRFVLPDQAVGGVNVTLDRRTLIAAADPSIVQSIHKLTKQWKFNTFHAMTQAQPQPIESHTPATMPLDQFGTNPHLVETHLAPHALLSLLAKQLICALISRGLEASNRDKAKALSPVSSRRRKGNRNQGIDWIRMLTPTHILSGILTPELGRGVKQRPVDAYLLLGLSRLGVAVDDDEDRDAGQNVSRVKVEDAA